MTSRLRFGTSIPIAARPGHPLDPHLFGGEGEGEVVLEGRDLRDLDAGRGLELVRRDDGPGRVGVHDALDAELEALGRDEVHRLAVLLAVAFPVPFGRRPEEFLGRKHPAGRVPRLRERKDALRHVGLLRQLRGPRDRPRRGLVGRRLADRELPPPAFSFTRRVATDGM